MVIIEQQFGDFEMTNQVIRTLKMDMMPEHLPNIHKVIERHIFSCYAFMNIKSWTFEPHKTVPNRFLVHLTCEPGEDPAAEIIENIRKELSGLKRTDEAA